jgi:hypothetical protein
VLRAAAVGAKTERWRQRVLFLSACLSAAGLSCRRGGTLHQITSEILEAIKLAFTQKLLGDLKLSSLQGTYYLCPATFLVLSIGFWVMESPGFIANRGLELMVRSPPAPLRRPPAE